MEANTSTGFITEHGPLIWHSKDNPPVGTAVLLTFFENENNLTCMCPSPFALVQQENYCVLGEIAPIAISKFPK